MMRSILPLCSFLLASVPAVALADVSIEFSDGVKDKLGGDPGATEQQTQLQDALNGALDGIGSGSTRVRRDDVPEGTTADRLRELARRLDASGQTIRILCREEARALGETDPVMQRLYEQSEPNPMGGGAATQGDFDADGNPRQGGTMIIVIECGRLERGWLRPMVAGGDTMLHTLGHELVHGVDADHVHDDDKTEEPYYDAFGDLIQRVTLGIARRQRRDKAKTEQDKPQEQPKPAVPPCDEEQ